MKYPITAKRLRDAMEAMNLTAQELADKSGVGKSSISHYVNGNNEPLRKNAKAMAKVLNVDTMYLMGFDEKTIEENQKQRRIQVLMRYLNSLTPQQLKTASAVIKAIAEENGINLESIEEPEE